jgi:hypothetical protein
MDATELAHWRYRLKALTVEEEKWRHSEERLLTSLTAPRDWVIQTTQGHDMAKYLLEEAKYMSELGTLLVPPVPRSEAGTTGIAHSPCWGDPCQVKEHWELRG